MDVTKCNVDNKNSYNARYLALDVLGIFRLATKEAMETEFKRLSKKYPIEALKNNLNILSKSKKTEKFKQVFNNGDAINKFIENIPFLTSPGTKNTDISAQDKPSKEELENKSKIGDNSFLYPYFATRAEAKNAFKKKFQVDLVRHILLDYENSRFIDSAIGLNNEICKLQLRYVEIIKSYLESIGKKEWANNIKMPYTFTDSGERIFTNKIMTLEEVLGLNVIEYFESGETGRFINPDMDCLIHSGNASKETLEKYRAFSAYVSLAKFDDLLELSLGKAISIERRGVFDNRNAINYNIVSAATMVTRWMTDNDSYDSIEELSQVSKLLISTLPEYNGDNETGENLYMTFKNVQQLYSKILQLANDLSTVYLDKSWNKVIDLDLLHEGNRTKGDILKEYLNGLFGETFTNYYLNKYVLGKTMAQVITATRENPTVGFPILFCLLNIESKTYKNNKILNTTEYNTLKGVWYNIFSNCKALVRFSFKLNSGVELFDKNYYNCLCQTLASAASINRFLESLKGENTGIENIKNSKLEIKLKSILYRINANLHIKNTIVDLPDVVNPNLMPGDFKIELRLKSGNNIDISVNDNKLVVVNNSQNYSKLDFLELVPIFSKVFSLDFENPVFQNTLLELLGGGTEFANAATKDLLALTSNILYNYYVNILMHQRNKELEASDFYDALDSFFGSGEKQKYPGFRKFEDSVQIELILNKDYPTLLKIARAALFAEGSSPDGTGKDGGGSLVSLQGLNMLGTIVKELFNEYNSKPNSATSGFSLLKYFKGLTLKRGVNSFDGFKNSIEFNEIEHFQSSFLYDFWSVIDLAIKNIENKSIYQGTETILIHSAVISDKYNIPYIEIPLSIFTKPNKSGTEISFKKEFAILNLQLIIIKEFGEYYAKMFNKILSDFNELNSNFNPLNNFKDINNEADEKFGGNKKLKKEYIQSKLHDAIVKVGSKVEIIEGLHYWFDSNGHIKVNPTILNLLFRWKQIKKFSPAEIANLDKYVELTNLDNDLALTKGFRELTAEEILLDQQIKNGLKELLKDKNVNTLMVGRPEEAQIILMNYELSKVLNEYHISETAEDFFKRKSQLIVTDIMQFSPRPITIGKNGTAKQGLKLLHKVLGREWTVGDNMVLFKIHNTSTDSKFNISSVIDFENWGPLERLKRYAEDNPSSGIDIEKIDVNNSKFNLQYTINSLNANAVNIHEYGRKLKEIREKLKKLSETFYNESVKNPNLANKLKKELKKMYEEEFNLSSEQFDKNWDANTTKNGRNFRDRMYVIYKQNKDAEYQKIANDEFEIELDTEYKVPVYNILVNPELVRYNLLDLWMGEEFTCATVGTFANHPFKSDPTIEGNIQRIEAEQYGQETKRTVTITASFHAYLRGLRNGIKNKYKIAIGRDIKDPVYNVYGKRDSTKSWDGATFINFLTSLFEDKSLGDLVVGLERKPIGHTLNFETGSGDILKTAGFLTANSKIRDCTNLSDMTAEEFAQGKVSGFYGIINKHMNDITWRDQNGNIKVYNWKKGLNKNDIKYNDIYFYNPFDKKHYHVDLDMCVFDQNSGITTIHITEVDSKGSAVLDNEGYKNEIEIELKIDSNWKLWKFVFGGEYSEHFNNSGVLTYELDNTSFLNLYLASINIAESKLSNDETKSFSSDDIYQPLKECMIDYIVTEGAFKLGVANVNSEQMYTDPNYKITTMLFDAFNLGIQLKAEHTATNSKVSLMTLVVNAIGARGYSSREAQEIYDALNYLTELSLKDILDGINVSITSNSFEKLKTASLLTISKILQYTSDQDGNILNSISSNLRSRIKNKDIKLSDLTGEIPLSHPGIYNQIVSKLATEIEKIAVRMKFSGGMNVLNPSQRIYELVGDKIKGRLSAEEIEELQAKANEITLLPYLIKLERSYTFEQTFILESNSGVKEIFNAGDTVKVDDPEVLWKLRRCINNGAILHENIKAGRDLGTYDCIMTVLEKDANGKDKIEKYTLFDLEAIHQCYELEKEYERTKNPEILNHIKQARRRLQESFNSLRKGFNVAVRDSDGTTKTVKIQDIETSYYEVIVPKNYADAFGLSPEDDLDNISKDKYFFLKKLLLDNRTLTPESNFSVELKTASKDNVYIIREGEKTKIPEELEQINIDTEWDGKVLWRVVNGGKRLYSIPYIKKGNDIIADIKLYRDEAGTEIIVTKDLKHFLDTLEYSDIHFGKMTLHLNLMDFQNSTNKVAKSIKFFLNSPKLLKMRELILRYDSNLITLEDFESELEKLKYQGNTSIIDFLTKAVIDRAIEIHTSYLKSLDYIASRTPAQSHLSFMAMKAVGYDNRNINSAYVSRWQIWLQGSDYDIDKGSMLGYAFNRGIFVYWSPFFDLSSKFTLSESEKYPFPTGKKLQVFTEQLVRDSGKRFFDYYIPRGRISLEQVPGGVYFNIDDKTVFIERNSEDENLYHIPGGLLFNETNNTGLTKQLTYLLLNALINYLEPEDKFTFDGESLNGYSLQSLGCTKEGNQWKISNNLDYYYDYKFFVDNFIETMSTQELQDPENIKMFNKLGFYVNKDTGVLKGLIDRIDSHNKYFEGKNRNNIRDALMNFISSRMILASASPVNLILGQSGVDAMVDEVGESINNPKYSKLASQTLKFDRGSITSKFRQLVLTIYGKKSVGIVASAMKVFEAMSQYYYQILNEGTREQQESLLSNFEILGRRFRLIANAQAVNSVSIKSKEVAKALQEIDNNLDAFLIFSAFLSMATDNAKDPKLAKINAGPEMLGLYTAGFTIGLSVDQLIEIALSPTGIVLSLILRGNVYEDIPAKSRIQDAISYIYSGPNLNYVDGELLKLVNAIVGNEEKSKSYVLSGIIASDVNIARKIVTLLKAALKANSEIYKSKKEGTESSYKVEVQDAINHLKLVNAREISKLQKKKYNAQLKNKSTEKIDKQLTELGLVKSVLKQFGFEGSDLIDIQEISRSETESIQKEVASNIIKYINDNSIETILNIILEKRLKAIDESRFFEKDEFINKARRLILDLEIYIKYRSQINNDKMVDSEGKNRLVIGIISKLNKVNQEMGILRNVLSLNQGLPNSIADLQSWINNFETDFKTFWGEDVKSERLEALQEIHQEIYNIDNAPQKALKNDKEISFNYFVSNPEIKLIAPEFVKNHPEYENIKYGDFVRDAYEDLKVNVNVYKVMWNVSHYKGYMEALFALSGGLNSVMSVYKNVSELSKIVQSYHGKTTALNLEKRNKAVVSYVTRRINNEFLHNVFVNTNAVNENYGVLMLGTSESNGYFRYWMEKEVFPYLKDNYKNNDFVKTLSTTTYNFNPRHNTTINYSSSISMSPRGDYEIANYSRLKQGFNLLSLVKYGNYTITDLIFLYNLIAYNGTPGQMSYTNLFEDIIIGKSSALINSYSKYISELDLSKNNSIPMTTEDYDELFAETASLESISDLKLGKKKPKLVWVQDGESFKFRLLSRILKSSDNQLDNDYGVEDLDNDRDEDNDLLQEIKDSLDIGDDVGENAGMDDSSEGKRVLRATVSSISDIYKEYEGVDFNNYNANVLINSENYKEVINDKYVVKNGVLYEKTGDKEVEFPNLGVLKAHIDDNGALYFSIDEQKLQKAIKEYNDCM